MASENWTEERKRLLQQLRDFEAGKATALDDVDDDAVVPATSEERLSIIRRRLAALDQRLDNKDGG